MKKGMASIILPIYGVEAYLDRCIESVVGQTYKELEIILVDDGSKDHCPEMCDIWAKKDSRIKVIHKENAGLGMARNSGMDVAEGEYIFFVDSDDYIAPRMVETIMNIARVSNSDMLLYGYSRVDSNGSIKQTFKPNTSKRHYEGDEVVRSILPDMIAEDPKTGSVSNLCMSANMRAYSYNLIHRNEWRFVSERDYISEDVYSILCLAKEVESIEVVPEAFYFYCENEDSLTQTFRADRYQRLRKFYEACQDKCDELGYNQIVKDRLSLQHMANVIGAMKLIVRAELSQREKKKMISEIVNDTQMQRIIHGISINNENLARKLLFTAIRLKRPGIVYAMVHAKS